MSENLPPIDEEVRAKRGDLIWSLIGRLSLTGANAALMLALALWFFDLETFGRFGIFVGLQLMLSRAVLAGQEQAIIRLHGTGASGASSLRAGIWIVAALGVAVIAVSAGAMLVPGGSLPSGWTVWMLACIGLGAAGNAWFDVACASWLARLSFRRAGLAQTLMPTLRAAATVWFAWAYDDPTGAFVAFSTVTLLCGAVAMANALRSARAPRRRAAFVEAFHYGKWIAMADAAMVLTIYQGAFLLTQLQRTTDAGRYMFALPFAQGLFAVYLAFYHAMLPRAVRLRGAHELSDFLRPAFRRAGLLAGCVLAVAIAIAVVVPWILTTWFPEKTELAGFAPTFLGLAAFVAALMLEAPLGVSCHALRRPRLQLAAMLLRIVAIALFGLWLAPAHGDFGAAVAQALGTGVAIAALAIPLRMAIRESGLAGSWR